MTLTIHTEEDQERQLTMTVEVAEARVEQAMQRKARELARDINIPGFRKGKVPYQVLVRRVGRDALRAEVIDELAQAVFEEALDEVKAEVYAQPRLDDLEPEPLVFKFTLPLSPRVVLGDYRALRRDIEPVAVSDEAVDEALERIRLRHQVLESVDRPAEAGDVVTVGGRGQLLEQAEAVEDATAGETAEIEPAATEAGVEEQEEVVDTAESDSVIFDEERIDLLLDSDTLFPGTSFVDNLIGAAVGDEKAFAVTFPETFEDEGLDGKEASFTLTLLDVKRRELPELDDELASREGDYESLEALRQSLQKNLQNEAEAQAREELLESLIDDLLVDAEITYPPAAVEQEIDEMVQNFKNQITRSGWRWEDFLRIQSTTEETMRDDFRENAVTRLRRRLVMLQFVLEEKLRLDEEDIDAEIEKHLESFGDNEDLKKDMRSFFREGSGFEMVSNRALMVKVYERAREILSGSAPDLGQLEEQEAAAGDDETAAGDDTIAEVEVAETVDAGGQTEITDEEAAAGVEIEEVDDAPAGETSEVTEPVEEVEKE